MAYIDHERLLMKEYLPLQDDISNPSPNLLHVKAKLHYVLSYAFFVDNKSLILELL